MANLPKVTPHHLLATGKGEKLLIKKSSGTDVDDKPKTSHPMLHPYHGKKGC